MALVFCAGSLHATSSGEKAAYSAATKSFQDAMWDRAEAQFAEFAQKYPQSPQLAVALLYQARAQFNQGKFDQAIALLTARQADAGSHADEFLFWRGEANFQNAKYAAAAELFGRLTRDFPAFSLRLNASIREAEALSKLGEWQRVAELLSKTNAPFRLSSGTGPAAEFFARGVLLLAEAELAQKHHAEAEATLQPLAGSKLAADLDWRRSYLICRSQLGAGRASEALGGSSNLVAFAETTGRRDLLAESIAFQAGILEQLGRVDDAFATYQRNLATNVPAIQQRQALAKVVTCALSPDKLTEAAQLIEKLLEQSPAFANADMAWLTLGELYLKQHSLLSDTNLAATAPATPAPNYWQRALTNFDRVILVSPNTALVAKAQLNRGWCFWFSNQLPESAEAFKTAAARLPPSEDLAVARFKLADVQFAQQDFTNALQNYQGALETVAQWPAVKDELTPQVLHQMVRVGLSLTNLSEATNAMQKLLQSYPKSPLADRSVLLVGQAFAAQNEPDRAREEFGRLLALFPESPLRADAELAIAQTHEQKSDWSAAITNYDSWLERFATNDLRPQAEFRRAMANFHARRDTNTLAQLTNFVARFPTNKLAPQAQWWLADHYYGQGDWLNAEVNYRLLSQLWPASKLARKAGLMSGRAAVGRQDYLEAVKQFTNLTSMADCPADLKLQATFAAGSALMLLDTGGTNRTAILEWAIQLFGAIHELSPTNEMAALAWGEIGTCYRQLASQDARFYANATNAYQHVLDSPSASVTARSLARIGLGLTLEKMAESLTGDEQIALLKLARDNYVDVFHGAKLREGETPDPFCVKKAGLETVRLLESGPLQDWEQLEKVCERLQKLLPPLSAILEKKKAKAREHLASAKVGGRN